MNCARNAMDSMRVAEPGGRVHSESNAWRKQEKEISKS